jgi:hypothetical protein
VLGKKKRPPLHKKSTKRGKHIVSSSTIPVTRATTRLAKAKEISKGISEIPKNKKGYLVDSDHISDMPEAMDSTSSDEEHYYTSKLLTSIVSQVSSLQVSQVSHFSHKCHKCQGKHTAMMPMLCP